MIPLKTVEELVGKHSALEKDLSSGKIDKKLFRIKKNATLIGNTKKAKRVFKFKNKTSIEKLISIMMENDLKIEQKI